jgi:hypothetical protein
VRRVSGRVVTLRFIDGFILERSHINATVVRRASGRVVILRFISCVHIAKPFRCDN